MRVRWLGALSAAFLAFSVPAKAASLLEKNFWLSGPNYSGVVPICEDPAVTGEIASRFAHTESTFWASNLIIQKFDHLREIGYQPWGPDFIPRRFCLARALTSDGRLRTVSYAIGEDLGMIGASWGVEYCVDGLDRPLAYAPNCRMAQP
jgi:hypothetical protein